MLAGFVLLIKGASFLVDGASSIARKFNVSDLVIGLTVVAFGTSTPELFVNIVASLKGFTDIAIGNILGSTIANILLILGVSSIVYPLPFKMKGNVDISIVVLANILLFGFMFTGKRRSLDRWEGILFLIIYASYLIFLIVKG
jgi:cation:H+ antiporter